MPASCDWGTSPAAHPTEWQEGDGEQRVGLIWRGSGTTVLLGLPTAGPAPPLNCGSTGGRDRIRTCDVCRVNALEAVRVFSSITFMQVRASLVSRQSG